jgi:hypothetical protein
MYLDWLTQLFEEAQVPYNAETAPWLDQSLRRIANAEKDDEETVYRRLDKRWLKNGRAGWQLLAGLLRHEVYARRDSPLRPTEGLGHYVNPTSEEADED